MKHQLTCLYCRRRFTSSRSWQNCCGRDACKAERARRFVKRARARQSGGVKDIRCINCGDGIPLSHGSDKYCSLNCGHAYRTRTKRHAEKECDIDEVSEHLPVGFGRSCASCAHGKPNHHAESGYECRLAMAMSCKPMGPANHWVWNPANPAAVVEAS